MLILTQSSCTKCRCFVSFLFLMWCWLVLDTAPQSRCYSRACPNILKRWRILPAHISFTKTILRHTKIQRDHPSSFQINASRHCCKSSDLLTRSFTLCGLYRSEPLKHGHLKHGTKRWLEKNFAIRKINNLENWKTPSAESRPIWALCMKTNC